MLPSPVSSLTLEVASQDSLDVREFSVREALNALFVIEISAVSSNTNIDFSAVIGQKAKFRAKAARGGGQRQWTGICSRIEQLHAEEAGVSTYALTIVPALWLLTQRRNYRIFQQISEPNIVLELLSEWSIKPDVRLRLDAYKERKYRVQYAESDFAFISRLLEDAGITFHFEDGRDDEETKLVFSDAPEKAEPRPAPLPFVATPQGRVEHDFVTGLRVVQQVRPGKYTVRDHDYRRAPDFPLLASATGGQDGEDRLERFHFVPGAFVVRASGGHDTPVADDHGKSRADLDEGKRIAENRLAAKRGNARVCVFQTSAADLRPGIVVGITNHPRSELAEGKTLLLTANALSGSATGSWSHLCEARFADAPYKPPLLTPKPRTQGVESATVVGPALEEIHTDEFARVRVHFHWDRQSKRDERSSCWIHVSQAWGGGSFGAVSLPRVGQEVLVDFLSADPDRPIIVGRVFTNLQKVPYPLPEYKNVTTIRSESTGELVAGAADPPGTVLAKPVESLVGAAIRLTAAEIDKAVKSKDFPARSPNGSAHRWKGSELTFDDTAGKETTYLQAQRDLNVLVKKSATTVIGDRRATLVGTDDVLHVRNTQGIKIDNEQSIIVENDILVQSTSGSERHYIGKLFEVSSLVMQHEALEGMVLNVGGSIILLRPDFIMIQADHVFINPGQDVVAAALATGQRPETPDEALQREAKEKAERDAKVAKQAKVERDAFKAVWDQYKGRPPMNKNPASIADDKERAATQPSEKAYWALKGMSATGGPQALPSYDAGKQYIMKTHKLDSAAADKVMTRFMDGG